jgi:tetraprenyl-beta-curcumene synthase
MDRSRPAVRERIALGGTFAGAALRFWLIVFPTVNRELSRLKRRAQEIPDPRIREVALQALEKRGNIEGAAAFAAFAPRRFRRQTIRALVAFQAAYNLTDTLAEQPSADSARNARRLHEELCVALDPRATHLRYLEHHAQHDDGGYLADLLDTCRAALRGLPSYPLIASAAQTAAERIVAFQSLGPTPSVRDRATFERWARELGHPGSELRWWEMAAAGGSSLAIHALILAAADPKLQAAEVIALERAYFPWVGALHSLLDSLVDQEEDADARQLSLVGCYPSDHEAVVRMSAIASEAARATRALPGGRGHQVMLAAMAGFYLHTARSSPAAGRAASRGVAEIADGVLSAIGDLARPALLVFATRSWTARLAGRGGAHRGGDVTGVGARRSSAEWCEGEGGVDAGAA